jgi:hypothetical protein
MNLSSCCLNLRFSQKNSVLWDIMQCYPLNVKRCFERTYRLHPQGRRISQKQERRESRAMHATCFHVGLFGLFFDPEYGGDMYLQNVGRLSADYGRYIPWGRIPVRFFVCYYFLFQYSFGRQIFSCPFQEMYFVFINDSPNWNFCFTNGYSISEFISKSWFHTYAKDIFMRCHK